jgi:hypothetical protein
MLRVLLFVFFCWDLYADYATCHLWGQMGNQMFQIAATTAYAIDHQCDPLFPNLKETTNSHLNYQFVFHRLNLSELPRGESFYNFVLADADYCKYVPIPYEMGKNIRLIGYYQNERYFAHHRDFLLKLFAPAEELLEKIMNKYGNLLKTPTVGVHVRTYIPDGITPEVGGIGSVTWEYFVNAMNQFSNEHTFLIFSDNIEWTKKNFPVGDRKIVFIEGNPHYFDFYCLSLCDHQIISPNSTFSWWAAYLNANSKKIVIVPHFWGNSTEEDAFPASWIRIYAKKGPAVRDCFKP